MRNLLEKVRWPALMLALLLFLVLAALKPSPPRTMDSHSAEVVLFKIVIIPWFLFTVAAIAGFASRFARRSSRSDGAADEASS